MADQKIPILLYSIAAIMGALGQYFYKKGSEKLSEIPVYLNLNLFLGVVMFCLVMLLFVVSLRMGGKISIVYPFYATTFIWGSLIGVFLENESWSKTQTLGLGFVLLGITMIALKGLSTTP